MARVIRDNQIQMDWTEEHQVAGVSERERFLASCQQEADSVLVDGQSVTIYTAVERPLDEKSGQRLADLANSAGLSGMVRSRDWEFDRGTWCCR